MFKFNKTPEKKRIICDPVYDKLVRLGFANPIIDLRHEVMILDVPQVYNESGTVYQDLLNQQSKLAIYSDKRMVLFNKNRSMEMDSRTLNILESKNVFTHEDDIENDNPQQQLFSSKGKETDVVTAFFDKASKISKFNVIKSQTDKIIETIFDSRNNLVYKVDGDSEILDNVRIDFMYKSYIIKGAVLKLDFSGFPAVISIQVDGRTVIEESEKSIEYGAFTFQQLEAMSTLSYDKHLRNEATKILESLVFMNFESMMSAIDIIPTRYPLTKDSCGYRVLSKLISKYY